LFELFYITQVIQKER